jgi:hypothetical protein
MFQILSVISETEECGKMVQATCIQIECKHNTKAGTGVKSSKENERKYYENN